MHRARAPVPSRPHYQWPTRRGSRSPSCKSHEMRRPQGETPWSGRQPSRRSVTAWYGIHLPR
eukprot:2678619-Pleurochrysis_carterae.AAC.1